ncbi:GTPase RsgA [Candidatus Woesearchaeota archaeon]|jgi:small GTP-binding protein|nr:GTPase RsgA [Candidatus Woesearchaeota archaeon]
MANFWKIVNEVISSADVLLLLLDARMVDKTRNEEIENKVKKTGKPLIYVITKSDLANKDETEKYKKELKPCVFVSAVKHHGTTMLRERILIEASKANVKFKVIRVGILGYPNVGKSTLINALSGRKAAKTSSMSGYTTGVQKIRADTRIMLLDTPGVIPYKEKDDDKHAFIGTQDHTKIKEPDLVVMKLIEEYPGKIEEFYKVKEKDVDDFDDKEEIIEHIAIKKKLLMKGNKPDIKRASKMIIRDWQEGKIV